jgi:hypothetical protein
VRSGQIPGRRIPSPTARASDFLAQQEVLHAPSEPLLLLFVFLQLSRQRPGVGCLPAGAKTGEHSLHLPLGSIGCVEFRGRHIECVVAYPTPVSHYGMRPKDLPGELTRMCTTIVQTEHPTPGL